jgi:hydroxymethylglutaryl-CoA reductase
MIKRGGGVRELRLRDIGAHSLGEKHSYSLDIFIDVCDSMGANITNTICERAKQIVSSLGFNTGIAVLSNYCV